MRPNSQYINSVQPFSSPLRFVDQNTPIRLQMSPQDFQKVQLSEGYRFKRRMTLLPEPSNKLQRQPNSIKICFKQNVAPFKEIQSFGHNHTSKHEEKTIIQFQTNSASTCKPRIYSSFAPTALPAINPFEISELQFKSQQNEKKRQEGLRLLLKQSDFQKIKELGKGKFGIVWLVRHKVTNFVCAMKIIDKSVVREEKVQYQIAKQLRIHNSLKHLNIIAFYGYFHNKDYFYILTEFATGGQVYSLLKKQFRLKEPEVAEIVRETADGLRVMHNLGFIHRDIKPENLVLQFNTVKICDFGWAAECSKNQMRKSICGTPLYYSPELVKQTEHNSQIDVWSLGILAYQLLIGRIPFKIWSQFDLPAIIEQKVEFPEYIELEEITKQFILRCLNKTAYLRPSLQSLRNHTYLTMKCIQQPINLHQECESLF